MPHHLPLVSFSIVAINSKAVALETEAIQDTTVLVSNQHNISTAQVVQGRLPLEWLAFFKSFDLPGSTSTISVNGFTEIS